MADPYPPCPGCKVVALAIRDDGSYEPCASCGWSGELTLFPVEAVVHPEYVGIKIPAADRWRKGKGKMADYLPGGKKWTGALGDAPGEQR